MYRTGTVYNRELFQLKLLNAVDRFWSISARFKYEYQEPGVEVSYYHLGFIKYSFYIDLYTDTKALASVRLSAFA